MKARVKSTGEIVDVDFDTDALANDYPPYRTNEIPSRFFLAEQLEWIDIEKKAEPDYWTRLEHQAAIAAMQAYIIASHISQFSFSEHDSDMKDCKSMAHALVEKMKNTNE